MNIIRLCCLSIFLAFSASAAYANPCESLLCMAGKLQGESGGSSCSQPISDYFSIISYGKHWRFSPNKTAAARFNYLNGCSMAGAANLLMRINAVYGAVLL